MHKLFHLSVSFLLKSLQNSCRSVGHFTTLDHSCAHKQKVFVSLSLVVFLSLCICMCTCMRVYMCLCVRMRLSVSVCLCDCMCVCVWCTHEWEWTTNCITKSELKTSLINVWRKNLIFFSLSFCFAMIKNYLNISPSNNWNFTSDMKKNFLTKFPLLGIDPKF